MKKTNQKKPAFMVKKLIALGAAAIMLFGVFAMAGCRYQNISFKGLEEMQEALPKDFYYFDMNQEGICETGKFKATDKEYNSDGIYIYVQYFIWYDVEYMIDGKLVKRKLQVVATRNTHSLSLAGKNAASLSPQPDLSEIDAYSYHGVVYSAKDKRFLLTISIEDDYNCYYFVLDGVKDIHVAEETEAFVAICEIAINGRYKVN